MNELSRFFAKLNSKGIPIPLARDPKTGVGSLTFTMAVLSFGICVLLLAGKIANLIGEVDYDNALWLLGLTLSTYLGRQFQKNGKQMGVSGSEQNQKTESESDNAGASK
jgi:hypothetical protein